MPNPWKGPDLVRPKRPYSAVFALQFILVSLTFLTFHVQNPTALHGTRRTRHNQPNEKNIWMNKTRQVFQKMSLRRKKKARSNTTIWFHLLYLNTLPVPLTWWDYKELRLGPHQSTWLSMGSMAGTYAHSTLFLWTALLIFYFAYKCTKHLTEWRKELINHIRFITYNSSRMFSVHVYVFRCKYRQISDCLAFSFSLSQWMVCKLETLRNKEKKKKSHSILALWSWFKGTDNASRLVPWPYSGCFYNTSLFAVAKWEWAGRAHIWVSPLPLHITVARAKIPEKLPADLKPIFNMLI